MLHVFSFPQRLQILYSPLHRFHKTSLHQHRYFTLFLKSASLYSVLSSGTRLGWPNIMAYGVKTGSWASSSRYDRGRLFSATSTSSKASSTSFHVSWPILLYYGHFKTPISLWNCPPPTWGLCLDKIATLFPDEQGSSEAVHVLPPHSTTSLRQQNFACYTNKSSWGGLFSWSTIWDTGWTPQLFGLAATPGGQLWLSCKQITNFMLFLFFLSWVCILLLLQSPGQLLGKRLILLSCLLAIFQPVGLRKW